MTWHDDVRAFHAKFNLPYHGDARPPELLSRDVLEFRLKFLLEEVSEFSSAHARGDLAAAADAIADLIYVASGTAHLMALPLEAVWDEVQRANMTKVRASGAADPLSKRGHALDVVKPLGFVPPDHTPVIEAARRAPSRTTPGCRYPNCDCGVSWGAVGQPPRSMCPEVRR